MMPQALTIRLPIAVLVGVWLLTASPAAMAQAAPADAPESDQTPVVDGEAEAQTDAEADGEIDLNLAEKHAIAEEEKPERFRGMQVEQNLDAQLPLDLQFTNSQGEQVRLGEFFDGEKPVLMALVYYRCPMLCDRVMADMVYAMEKINWTPGQEYRAVVVSFNPKEPPSLAAVNKQNFEAKLSKPGSGKGLHFLVGSESNIRQLADTLGFPYRRMENDDYDHPPAVFVLTPSGRISKYLLGLGFEPRTVRLSLVEASQGRIGSLSDRIVLMCSYFDAQDGTYSASAFRIMGLTALAIGAAILVAIFIAVKVTRPRHNPQPR